MKRNAKRILAWTFSILAWVVGFFVGGFLLFIQPVYMLITGFVAGTLTKFALIKYIVEIFLASTVGGAIWCVFDIIAGLFREIEDD